MLLQISFQQSFKSCPNPNVFGDKVSCLWKLSPNILYPGILRCRYMVKYKWNLHGCFILKVLLNPTNVKFQVASSFSTSFLWWRLKAALSLLSFHPCLIPAQHRQTEIPSGWSINLPFLLLACLLLFPLNPLPPMLTSPLQSFSLFLPHEMSHLRPEWVTSSPISAPHILF